MTSESQLGILMIYFLSMCAHACVCMVQRVLQKNLREGNSHRVMETNDHYGHLPEKQLIPVFEVKVVLVKIKLNEQTKTVY